MNLNRLTSNLEQFMNVVVEYWEWFIDDHANTMENNQNALGDNAYFTYSNNNDEESET